MATPRRLFSFFFTSSKQRCTSIRTCVFAMRLPGTINHYDSEKEVAPVETSHLHQQSGVMTGTALCSPISDGTMAQTQMSSTEGSASPPLLDMPLSTFHLPNLSVSLDGYWDFAEKDLIEQSTMMTLESAGCLNWWTRVGASCQRLLPLVTKGDGNCLLHAASMSIWGIHDRDLTLRKSLHAQMDHGLKKEALRRRWRWQQTQQNRELGLQLTEEEWQKEWDELLKLASSEPKTQQNDSCNSIKVKSSEMPIYESLEEFHVFVLAHVLQRPIIVVADTMLRDSEGDAFAPIPFGGIYLPLEVPAIECQSSPLVLAYDNGHFSALASVKQKDSSQGQAVIPLTDSEHHVLPIHFAVDPGEQWEWEKDMEDNSNSESVTLSLEAKLQLLHSYLNVIWLPLTHHKQQIPLALADPATTPTGHKGHKSSDSGKLDREADSGHFVGAGDGAESQSASRTKGTNIFRSPQGLSGTWPHCKKNGTQTRQVNLVSNKLGGLRNSLSSKILNMGGLMAAKTGGAKGGAKLPEECYEMNKSSQKGNKGNSGDPEVSGNLSSPGGEQHDTLSHPCRDRNDVKLSVDILKGAMQGDRNYIFAALLSTFSQQASQKRITQSLYEDLNPRWNLRKKEASVPQSSSELQVEKKVNDTSCSTTPKDNSSSPLHPHGSNSLYPSIYHSIFPFAQPTVMFFTHASIMVTRKMLGDSFPSLSFVPSSSTPSQHFVPSQDAPNVQHCTAEKDSDYPTARVPKGEARSSLNNVSREIHSSPPPMSHSSLDSRAELPESQPRKCRTTSCSFYGRPETRNYCSCCYREELQRSKAKPDFHRS